MQIRYVLSVFAVSAPLVLAACGSSNSPSAPTAPTASTPVAVEPPLSVQGVSAVPDSTGVQLNTDFQFTVAGTFPSGTEFVWNFGDGTTQTTTTPRASRVYTEPGVFAVNVSARRGSEVGSTARNVSVRSLLGRWFGKITGFTSFPLSRPVPMTEFELLVANQTKDGSTLMLHGRWADDAGCRENRLEFLRQRLDPAPTATVTFGMNQLSCASGDFYLTGEADATFDHVSGHCNVLGNNPNCRFTMVRE